MAEAREVKGATVKAVVARGRTVQLNIVERADGPEKHIIRVATQTFGPGAEVELPVDEVSALRLSGVLLKDGETMASLPVPQIGAGVDVLRPR